ncbi:MAG: SLC13 family permease [Candidatus Bathyarchaeota archaeon]|nr:SLC13 family permease [Candidatus Bathyarchaeota archaeon]
MNAIQTVSVAIFIVTIILIATERIHRIYAALLAAGAMVMIGAVKPDDLLHFIDVEILGVIIGMMLLVRGAERSGIFSSIAVRIMKASRTPTSFAIILMSFTMILSMLLNNIGAMLISATITITMTRSLKMKPETFFIFQAILANLGGMMLMMSSIPNIIVAVEGGLSFSSFVINIAPLGMILFAVTILIFMRIFRAEVEKDVKHELRPVESGELADELIEAEVETDIKYELRSIEFSEWVDLSIREFGSVGRGRRQIMAAVIMAVTIMGFAVYDRLGLTPALVALTGGSLMLMFSGEEPTEALREVDWSTILFLAGLFIMINGMDKIGLIEMLSIGMLNLVGRVPLNMPISVMWLSALPSALLDNIPLTAAFAPIMRRWVMKGASTDIWWGLVLGANLGGSLTPIGSPSSIIALGVAEQEGQPIPLGRFFKLCFGVTIVHLVVSTLYLYIIYSLM